MPQNMIPGLWPVSRRTNNLLKRMISQMKIQVLINLYLPT
jgi:hypothetical protein